MKKIILITLSILLCSVFFTSCESVTQEDKRLNIVSTVFPGYDFARAIAGDKAEVSMLLPAGAESHHYEPTPKDIARIRKCDLFIYTGGESDTWVENILSSLDTQIATIKMISVTDDTSDEHVWTSPLYAGKISELIKNQLCKIDSENESFYQDNYLAFSSEIQKLDKSFRDFFETKKPTLVFGDRFPLKHFADLYGITYYSPFAGCSAETEPEAKELAEIIKVIKSENISTVFYIEFSNQAVAKSIQESTGVKLAGFNTCHNISKDQFDNGATYISLMEENLETLKEAF